MPPDLVVKDDTDNDFRMRYINADIMEIFIRHKGNAVIEHFTFEEAEKMRAWIQEFLWERNS